MICHSQRETYHKKESEHSGWMDLFLLASTVSVLLIVICTTKQSCCVCVFLCLLLFSAAKPTPLDLKNNGIIDELPFKSPVTMSWIRPM